MFKALRIAYSNSAKAFLEKIEVEQSAKIKRAIRKMPDGDIKRIQGSENRYRLRLGGIRVLFERNGYKLDIVKIDNRGDVYK
ncbi:hypothetical protein FACS1894208_01590 [Clostridia bacterium]|nr:hypothetical protein FACS1894208_01590 [Clostridia bacterium]